MSLVLTRVLAFIGRHWLRLLIAGTALVLFSKKQINFNVRLGTPVPMEVPDARAAPAPEAIAPTASALSDANHQNVPQEKSSFFEQFNLFGGGSELSFYDQLTRVEDLEVAAFIRRFSNVAQAEQDKFGIPASITLASALLHVRAGKTDAAVRYQSYFSLSCGADWPGPTARVNGRCIRTYESAWTSFRDHSLYVTSGRFSPLLQFGETDYRRWAAGLEELGFNETDNLAEQLLRTIDHYQLFQYD
ncbi:MAG: glucosaminidase domain-containing protein [Bacteroidota bacterium]